MVESRDLSLSEYGISKTRYRELKNFCLQYNDWKKELANMPPDTVKAANKELPCSTGATFDSTSSLVARREFLQRKCERVEQAALAASGDLYQHIIKGVTNDYTYDWLRHMGLPCSRATYYRLRRKFFYYLSKS